MMCVGAVQDKTKNNNCCPPPLPKKAPVLPMGCVWYYSSASFK